MPPLHGPEPPDESIERAVVVTGASSGIGEATALALAEWGFRVFAGVRRVEDGERLQAVAGARLTPVPLDVTRADSIANAARAVTAYVGDTGGLTALVNNAGIVVSGPLVHVAPEDLRQQLDVNVVGLIAVTQAFLPLLRRARGRIVNVGSTSGRIAGPLIGAYCASKFALEAATQVLRMELRGEGIFVSIIEPGIVATPLWDKLAERDGRLAARLATIDPPSSEALAARRRRLGALKRSGQPPAKVARRIVEAVTSTRPRKRYVVGLEARLKILLARALPEDALDRLRRMVAHAK